MLGRASMASTSLESAGGMVSWGHDEYKIHPGWLDFTHRDCACPCIVVNGLIHSKVGICDLIP